MGRGRRRQPKRRGCATSWCFQELKCTAVQFRKVSDNAQPKTDPSRFAIARSVTPFERLDQTGAVMRRYAGPMIHDIDENSSLAFSNEYLSTACIVDRVAD